MSEHRAAIEIDATVEQVWALLIEEARLGVEYGRARVLEERRERQLVIEVHPAWGFYTTYDYRLLRRGEGATVELGMRPHGLRWRWSNAALFGRGLNALAAAADAGLANLKAQAEGNSTAPLDNSSSDDLP